MYKYRGWNIEARCVDGVVYFVRYRLGAVQGFTHNELLDACDAIDYEAGYGK